MQPSHGKSFTLLHAIHTQRGGDIVYQSSKTLRGRNCSPKMRGRCAFVHPNARDQFFEVVHSRQGLMKVGDHNNSTGGGENIRLGGAVVVLSGLHEKKFFSRSLWATGSPVVPCWSRTTDLVFISAGSASNRFIPPPTSRPPAFLSMLRNPGSSATTVRSMEGLR